MTVDHRGQHFHLRHGAAESGILMLAAGRHTLWDSTWERTKGGLLLQSARAEPGQAESCFLRALDIARCQQARSLELRAALSLSQLWQRSGRVHAARQLSGDTYSCFTEGFDTGDLMEARALRDSLA